MAKKVRNPKDITLRTGRFATRTTKPFLGRLNRPISKKKILVKGGTSLDNGYILDSMKLL